METPAIFYYGPRDVASEVFKSYMACLGFHVRTSQDSQELFHTLVSSPALVIILLADGDPAETLRLAHQIRECAPGPCYPIFVLASVPLETNVSYAQVISRPNALGQVAERLAKWAPGRQFV